MELALTSWGNSLGLRIPKTIVQLLGIKNGSKVTAEFKDGKLILAPAHKNPLQELAKEINLKSLVSKVTMKNRPEREDESPVGHEVW